MPNTSLESLGSYVKLYNELYFECLSTHYNIDGNDAACVSLSAWKTINKLNEDLSKRGPNCDLSSYYVVMMREAGLGSLQEELTEAAKKLAVKEVLKIFKKFAVPLAGCAVGGTIASIGGGVTGFFAGGKEGAQLGAAISFPLGCAEGAAIASEVYIYSKGFKKLSNLTEFFQKITTASTKIYHAWQNHHKSCNAMALSPIPQTGAFSPLTQKKPLMTPIFWDKVSQKSPVNIYTKPPEEPITAPYKVVHTMPSETIPSVFSKGQHQKIIVDEPKVTIPSQPAALIPFEEVALKIVGFAGDLTGINQPLMKPWH